MPFKKGNQLGKKSRGGGRPSKQQQVIKQEAAELAKQFIEHHCKPVLETYLKNAGGRFEKRFTDSGAEYEIWVVDAATTRHWIDKLVPPRAAVDKEGKAVAPMIYQMPNLESDDD